MTDGMRDHQKKRAETMDRKPESHASRPLPRGPIANAEPHLRWDDSAPTASAERPLYHAAPRHCRGSIEQHGLDSSRDTLRGLPGTYLWQTIALASGYAAPLGDDIWVVECSGIPLEFGGPHSIHPGERWTPHPIPRERLLGRLPRHASRQPTEKPPEVYAAIVARRGQPRRLALVVIPANGYRYSIEHSCARGRNRWPEATPTCGQRISAYLV